jgi:NTP pyrophosphatase (non-canonical NTP hydrolase)
MAWLLNGGYTRIRSVPRDTREGITREPVDLRRPAVVGARHGKIQGRGAAMEFEALQQKAIKIREQYAELERKEYGRSWSGEEVALGFVGDVGDLVKLVMAESGVRSIPDARQKLAHELADCLWSVLVLSHLYDVDLEPAFLRVMDELEQHIAARLRGPLKAEE